MLLALAVLTLGGLWWLGRSGGRLPVALTPRRLGGYAAVAVAALLAARGQILIASLVLFAGLALMEGPGALSRRLRDWWAGPRSPIEPMPSASVAFEIAQGAPVDGLVLAGPLRGRRLTQCPRGDLLDLRAWLADLDPPASRMLEAHLDGRYPGWRVDAERDAHARPRRPLDPGAMTHEEAYQVLGLERGASLDEIRAAHRALMKRLHPDQGGTAEGAARINAARDRLLDRHR